MEKNILGLIHVICGPMFSGKTEELIRRARRAFYGNKKVLVFKHAFDDRYEKEFIVTHIGDKINCKYVKHFSEIEEYIDNTVDSIFIDEIQFFDKEIIILLMKLRDRGIEIVVAGLDLDFRGIPFGPIPELLALADEVTKLKAVCFRTGKDAQYSQRLINGKPAKHTDPIILVAASDCYEARSREAFEIDYVPMKEYLKHKKCL